MTLRGTTNGNITKPLKPSRPSYVCTNCRRRKVKCDRKKPCTRCIKSGLQDSCVYTVSIDDIDEIDEPHQHQPPIDKHSGDNSDGSARAREGLIPDISSGPMISNIPSKSLDVSPIKNTKEKSKLFNYETLEFKKPFYLKEDNCTKFKSPFSLKAIFSNNKKYEKFKSMMPSFQPESTISNKLKTPMFRKNEELELFAMSYSKQDIDKMVATVMLPNYDAIKERLYYFEQTKNLLTEMFISYDKLLMTLDAYFIKDPNEVGKILYKPPIDDDSTCKTVYAIFANVLSVAQITLLMTEDYAQVGFKTKLVSQPNEISYLALKCIAYANWRDRPTFELMLAFLLYRIGYFMTDTISDKSNATEFFKIALEIAYKLGIHMSSDHIENYTKEQVTASWNMLQYIDATSSVYLGEPLKIDYKYCIPRLYEFWQPIILYLRNVVISFSSTEPITLNNIINLINSSSRMLSIFKPYDDLLSLDNTMPFQCVVYAIIKCDFVCCYQVLLFSLRLALDKVDSLPIEIEKRDLELIDDTKNKTECLLFYSLMLTFGLIKKLSFRAKLAHDESSHLVAIFRPYFGFFIIIGNNLAFCYISLFNKKLKYSNLTSSKSLFNSPDKVKTVKFDSITLLEAENFLYKGINSVSTDDSGYIKMMTLMESLSLFSEYLMEFYEIVSENKTLLKHGTLEYYSKLLLFICLLIKNMSNYEGYGNLSDDAQSKCKIDEWKDVINQTLHSFNFIEKWGLSQYHMGNGLEQRTPISFSEIFATGQSSGISLMPQYHSTNVVSHSSMGDIVGGKYSGTGEQESNLEINDQELKELYEMFF